MPIPHFSRLTPAERAALLRKLPEPMRRRYLLEFAQWAHPGQLPPSSPDWRTWVLMAGRGFGKTRAGAEWVLGLVRPPGQPRMNGAGGNPSPLLFRGGAGGGVCRSHPRSRQLEQPRPHPSAAGKGLGTVRIALVAATIDEARAVMVEGPSGILACAGPGDIADWQPSLHLLRFAGGAEARLYSGANPEALRGPQHHFAWCDELAKWRHPLATWHMLRLGLRCVDQATGQPPRALVTTTPRGGCAALAQILGAADTAVTGGRSGDNPHLPADWLAAVEQAYGGTRMGREELDGRFLPDVAGSLWPATLIAASRGAAPALETLTRVVVGVDPPASAEGTCGIVVCGLDPEGRAHVLADHSAGGLSPEGWARAVAAAAARWGADRVVAEKNMGGDMVRTVLNSAGAPLAIRLVSATRSKVRRAEPIAGRFEAGAVTLAGRFPELEDELAGLVTGGSYAGPGRSPDRADAMVWALWDLLIAAPARVRVSRV